MENNLDSNLFETNSNNSLAESEIAQHLNQKENDLKSDEIAVEPVKMKTTKMMMMMENILRMQMM